MAGAGTITIRGNLGADAEVQTTKGGTEVLRLSVAVGVYKKLPDGSSEDIRTDWFEVAVWGNRIGSLLDLKKGQRVEVTGALTPGAYLSNDGEARSSSRIDAWSVLLVPRAPKQDRTIDEPQDWAPSAEATAGAPF